jgi:hypothetical protein
VGEAEHFLNPCALMFLIVVPKRVRSLRCRAFTLIELLALIFIITAIAIAEQSIARKYGRWPGIGAGIVAGAISLILVVLFYRWWWRRNKRRLKELREKHRTIYRVISLPVDNRNIIKPDGAEIKVGDYGWEAGPINKEGSGLIYLQGLTAGWRVV